MNHIEHSSTRLPLHVEISEMLAREIEAGILLDGTKLPPERIMAEELGVAVGTLRKALLELTEKGLIDRVHGSGNYVRKSNDKNQTQTIYRFFRLELKEGGGLPTAKILSFEKVKKPNDLPKFGNSKFAFRIRRLRMLNNKKAALEEIWVDAPRERIINQDDLTDSLYQFYKEHLGFWITKAEDHVSLKELPDWSPNVLIDNNMPKQNIWGYIERYSYDQTNLCSEYSRTWYNPKITNYVARIK